MHIENNVHVNFYCWVSATLRFCYKTTCVALVSLANKLMFFCNQEVRARIMGCKRGLKYKMCLATKDPDELNIFSSNIASEASTELCDLGIKLVKHKKHLLLTLKKYNLGINYLGTVGSGSKLLAKIPQALIISLTLGVNKRRLFIVQMQDANILENSKCQACYSM